MKRNRMFIALPLALVLIAGTSLLVRAAEGEDLSACADIIGGEAAYKAPVQTLPGLPQSWVTPGKFAFNETLAAPTCPDVQYGLVVLAEDPLGGAPTVLASQAVPGDGVSNELNFSFDLTSDPAQETICVYLYTVGSSGSTSTTTPGTGNPHGQSIASASTGLLDRAPDGAPDAKYCNEEGAESGGRTYN